MDRHGALDPASDTRAVLSVGGLRRSLLWCAIACAAGAGVSWIAAYLIVSAGMLHVVSTFRELDLSGAIQYDRFPPTFGPLDPSNLWWSTSMALIGPWPSRVMTLASINSLAWLAAAAGLLLIRRRIRAFSVAVTDP